MDKPELVAPAGNLERLKIAVLYGADAVYLGGQCYGLRARADNFTDSELERAVKFAHENSAKVIVCLNAFFHDEDMMGLAQHCRYLENIGVDAVTVSDLGVIKTVQKNCNIPIHLSTQASCINRHSARIWKELGVKKIILGRELSIKEAIAIKNNCQISIEIFIHGAMCTAYSGHCTISNYTAGRDSNRGGCIQSCRFPYSQNLSPQNASHISHFMSSKDLLGIRQIPLLISSGIDSFKIEGRMKSALYIAVVTKTYRKIIDACIDGRLSKQQLSEAKETLKTTLSRGTCTGSLEYPADSKSIYEPGNHSRIHTLGTVIHTSSQEFAVRLNAPIQHGDIMEILPFTKDPVRWEIKSIKTIVGEEINKSRQDTVVRFPMKRKFKDIAVYNVARRG